MTIELRDDSHIDEPAPTHVPRGRWVDLVFVLLLVAVSVGLLVDFRGITLESLGARHAAAARDFYQRRAFFDIQFNHAPYLGKPAFPFWILSLPAFVFGPSDAALRAGSEFFGVGLVLMACFVGRWFFGRVAGLFAGLVLAVNLILPWVVRHTLIDTGALVLLTLPVLCFYAGWRDERRRTLWVFLFYFTSALATWYRGPLGAVLPGVAVAAVLVPLGQWRVLGQFLNPLAIVMWLVLVVPYYWALGVGFGSHFFIQETLEHYFVGEPTGSGPKPPYFWPANLMFRYLPWTLFFLLALNYAWRRRRSAESHTLWFLSGWLGSWFLFWFMAGARNETYTLVLGLPVALLTGYGLAALWNDPDAVADTLAKRLWLLLAFITMSFVSAAAPIGTLAFEHARFALIPWVIISVGLGLAGLAVFSLAAVNRFRAALVSGTVLAFVTGLILAFWVKPATDAVKPGRPLFVEVRRLVDDRPVILYGRLALERHMLGAVFYLRSPHAVVPCENTEEAKQMWRDMPDAVIVASAGKTDLLQALSPRTEPQYLAGGEWMLIAHPRAEGAEQEPVGQESRRSRVAALKQMRLPYPGSAPAISRPTVPLSAAFPAPAR